MYLHEFHITNYRSVEEQQLRDISNLNVLIGKNNSGKSTILNAIEIFFSSLKTGEIVILNSAIQQNLDFHKHNYDEPIELSASLRLSLAERDELINDIATQVPEMKNAISSIPTDLLIHISLRTLKTTTVLSYINRITYTSANDLAFPGDNNTLFSADDRAALELHTYSVKANIFRNQAAELERALSRIDRDGWESITRMRGRDREYSQALIGRLTNWTSSTTVEPLLRRAIEEAASYEDFQQSLKSLTAELEQSAKDAEKTLATNPFTTFTGSVPIIPTYIRNLIKKVGLLKVHHLRETRRGIGPAEAERLLKMKVSRGGQDNLREIQGIVAGMLGVQVDAFATDAFGREYPPRARQSQPTAELDVDNFLVEANGSGIREALRMIFDFEFEQPNIFLIEEPEVHLHPALEINMLRYLRMISQKSQIFITTHSTNFLDTSDLGNVYLVQKPDSTTIRLLNVDDLVEEIPAELGIRLSSLFMFDRLVFVEGITDEAILREWASKIKGANLMTSNVGFIHLEGARNVSHYAAEKIISFLSKRQVKCWFLTDRDEKEDEDVKKLMDLLGERAKVHVLERREIENYLFSPRAVMEHIRARLPKNHDPVELTTEGVQRKIEDASEKMRSTAVHKRLLKKLCGPNYSGRPPFDAARTSKELLESDIATRIAQLQKSFENLDETVKLTEDEVNSVWDTNKLRIVPGEEVLSFIFSTYRLAYKKDRDGPQIAAKMRGDEIDAEITKIIKEIVA